MENDFFDWLNECPAQWFLQESDDEGRTYWFKDNSKDEE